MVQSQHIILFDGMCNMCSGIIRFISKRDKNKKFNMVSIQSDEGKILTHKAGISANFPDTFVYVRKGVFLIKSTASLYVLKDLGGLWKLLYGFIVIPRFFRDLIYDFIAHNRYRLFGKNESCKLNP